MSLVLVLSCEHGGNRIPARWRARFAGAERLLASHRGLDAGALAVARHLARRLKAPLMAGTTSRLLVDLNRRAAHPRCFSELTRGLPAAEREEILVRHHAPYREAVRAMVAEAVRRGSVLHVSVHSFVPVLQGRVRDFDVGLLYDPGRRLERGITAAWKGGLARRGLAVRRNAPYRGVSEGMTKWLRSLFADRCYAGIELEVSQRLLVGGRPPAALLRAVEGSLQDVLEGPLGRARPGPSL